MSIISVITSQNQVDTIIYMGRIASTHVRNRAR